ncbi:MAG: hypothetical protein GXP02_02600 [Alphaproteobacteria bacterium]|nr:hypothetical protein [Alphaproteobacteria bacterium]
MLKIPALRFIRRINKKYLQNYYWTIALCLATGVIIIAITLYAEKLERDNFSRKTNMDTLNMLTMIRTKLENELSKDLFQLRALAAYISVNPKINKKDFDIFAHNLLRQKSDVISYGAAPDLVVKYVYPYAGNEAAIGLDYRKSSTQRNLALLAMDTGEQVMTDPLISVQGKYVLIARAPIYLAEDSGNKAIGDFWGLVSILIDAKKLFKSIRAKNREYDISLRGRENEGHTRKVFFGNPKDFNDGNITLPIYVPGGSWQISAIPKAALQSLPREIKLIRLTGLTLFIAAMTFFIFRIRYMRERSIADKQLERALIEAEKASRAKSEFLASMSHELRTPLNAIIGFSDLICGTPRNKISREKVAEYARDINDSGHHLLEIINDILDLSKVESGNFTTTIESVYLQDVVEQCLRLIRNSISRGEITTVTHIADDLQPLQSDERMLRQIFLNLLSNAVKFTPKGGRITLSAQARENGTMEITLADTGIGMSEDGLKIAMRTFGQVDSYLVRTQQGTGLGLPLVKVFVELLGGDFSIQSEIGVGTEITLIFPTG